MWQEITSDTLLVDPDKVRAVRLSLENRAIDLCRQIREAEHVDPWVRVRNFQYGTTDKETTRQNMRLWLTSITNMPLDDFLVTLACFPGHDVNELASVRWLPETVYRVLAVYPDLDVLHDVVEAQDCPEDVLTFLAGHHSPEIRAGVAATRAGLPHQLQVVLSQDTDAFVRLRLAQRSDIDPELLATMMENESDSGVWFQAAKNPLLPVHAAKALLERGIAAGGDEPWLLELLRAGLRYGDEELTSRVIEMADAHPDAWYSILSSPNTPVEVLVKAGRRRSRLGVEEASALACNPATPAETLARLAKDRRVTIARAVASHPNTSVETIVALGNSQDSRVVELAYRNPNMPVENLHAGLVGPRRVAAAANPSTPPDVLAGFMRWAVEHHRARGIEMFSDTQAIYHGVIRNPALPVEAWEELLRGEEEPGRSFKRTALQSHLCPPHLLVEGCMSREASLRQSAAANKNCPEEGKIAAALFGAA